MKSRIGLIFCRNMLMDSLQAQLKHVLAEIIGASRPLTGSLNYGLVDFFF